MKKFYLILLSLIFTVTMTGCSTNTTTKNYGIGDSAIKTEVNKAFDNLKKIDKAYYVTSILSLEGSTQSYLEINRPDGTSYKEVPVDSQGNYGVLDDIEGYQLVDWLTLDGDMYNVNQYGDDEDNVITRAYKYPNSFAEYNKSRRYLFLDKLLDSMYQFKDGTDSDINLGDGDGTYHTYLCKLKSDAVKHILAVDTYEFYNCIIKDYPDNKNVNTLCEYYLQDLDMDLTFSDANIVIGVKDNILRYIELEVGGLGTRLYCSKALVPIDDDDFDFRETPDFSEASDYVKEKMQSDADYISTFSSYDDALKALKERNSSNSNNQSELLEDTDISKEKEKDTE